MSALDLTPFMQYGFAGFALYLMWKKIDELTQAVKEMHKTIIDKIAPQKVTEA